MLMLEGIPFLHDNTPSWKQPKDNSDSITFHPVSRLSTAQHVVVVPDTHLPGGQRSGTAGLGCAKALSRSSLSHMNVLVVLKDFFKDAGILYWAERVHGWEL